MSKDSRSTLDPATRNENIGVYIVKSDPVTFLDSPSAELKTVIMNKGTSAGIVAYKNAFRFNPDGSPITGLLPLAGGEKALLLHNEILTTGTTVAIGDLYWGTMST